MEYGLISIEDKQKLSSQLHTRLCDSGFTIERVRLQVCLIEHLEDLYKDLYDEEQYSWFIAGSYGDVWGNNLFVLDGQTDEHESDVDWTCSMRRSTYHFKGHCECSDVPEHQLLLTDNVDEGHIKCSFEHLREPAEPHEKIGLRPKVDECAAYPCCRIPLSLLRAKACSFHSLDPDSLTRNALLIQASRPGHESSELRFSFARVERELMHKLSVVQGQLFILIKYFMLHIFNIDLFAFKSYHAKTLLFYAIESFAPDSWKADGLIDLLIQSFDLLIRFIKQCAERQSHTPGFHSAIESFFLKDCFIYYHKKMFSDNPHVLLIQVIQKVKCSLAKHLNFYMNQLKPLQPNDAKGAVGMIFHPYVLLPIRLTLQFSKPKNARMIRAES